VVELLRRVRLTWPDAVALEYRGARHTYARFWSRAISLADAFREAGVVPGDRVAVWAERTPDTLAAILAILMLRAAYVPIDPAHPEIRVQHMLTVGAPRLLAFDGSSAVAPPPVAGLTTVEIGAVPDAVDREFADQPRPDDIAYIMFTSGSTGTPKGVMITHRSLVNYATWGAATLGAAMPGNGQFGIATAAGSALFGSLGFDHSLTALWPTLLRGERLLVLAGHWETEALFRPRPHRFAFMKVTPSHLRFFDRTSRPEYQEIVRTLVVGGETLDTALIGRLRDRLRGVRLVNHYGPTEATVGCCYHVFDCDRLPALPSVPIGRPLWNTRAYLVDEHLRPARTDRPAELIIAGAGVAAGYLGGDDGADRFVDEADVGGPPGRAYRTGDWVELLDSGDLLFVGRVDGQLKVNGHRVEAGDLRRQALLVPGVTDAAFCIDQGDVDTVEAFVVTATDASASATLPATVRRALATVLPPALVPRRVHVVPELVLNANGKCDVEATRQRFAHPAQAMVGTAAERDGR
jgi:amino acid adenylation domain-containing protein